MRDGFCLHVASHCERLFIFVIASLREAISPLSLRLLRREERPPRNDRMEFMEIGETLYVTTREEFRKWLKENHQSKKEVWLIQYKKATKKPSINYVDAVEEAICF